MGVPQYADDIFHRFLSDTKWEGKKVLYEEWRMMTIGFDEVPEFTKYFKKYGFDWMIRAPSRYSEVIVRESYIAYKSELIRLYLEGMLWKGGKPITFLEIRGFCVDISLQTIRIFLYGSAYQDPAKIAEMDYRMAKIRKITNQTLDRVSTSSAPLLVQSMLPRPRGMPPGVMMISQATWIEVVTQFATLAAKVASLGYYKEGRNWCYNCGHIGHMQLSMGSLSYVDKKKREMVKDIHRFDNFGVHLLDSEYGGVIV
ncbi:hypothetical protein FXO38_13480 [Capsicum annuum]|nr:hypothetical protein FXO38_13480 [Capsicum annuum]